MSMSSNSVVGIVLVVVLAALIGSIFIGDVLGQVDDEGSNQVVISSQEEMMKLILYDAMIAYGCDVGGNMDLNGDKFWGDWKTMETYADPGNPDRINFQDLNSSMPKKFEGLPCYGTGSTLPGTGTAASNTAYISKEWRDDQEGKYSKIEFKINDSNSASDITLPKCFVHHTASNPTTIGHRPGSDQYETRDQDSEVTNSWFLMSEQQTQDSVFLRGQGWTQSSLNCKTINPNSPPTVTPEVKVSTTQRKKWNHGPAMNVEVLDDNVGVDLSTGTSSPITGVGDFASDIDITDFEFKKGTTGYIQTNTGCTSVTAPHSIADTPGVSDKEIKGDGGTCDNKLHPFIVITSVP